jgi:hypothetical protein
MSGNKPTRTSPRGKRDSDLISHSEDDESDEPPTKRKKNAKEQIQDLESKMLAKQTKIQDFRDQIRKLKIENKELNDRDTMLVDRIQELEQGALTAPLGVPKNEGYVLVVDKKAKGPVWHKNKFIADEDELDMVMKNLMLSTDHGTQVLDGLSDVDQKQLVRSYSLTYGYPMLKTINGRRSTTQSAIQKAVMKRGRSGKRIPTVATLLQIIRRKGLNYVIEDGDEGPTPENKTMVDGNREIFDWYVDELLVKVCGISMWGPNQKFYGNVSTWAPPGDPENPYISANSEAFVQLMFENCEVKWSYMLRCIKRKVAINDKSKKMDAYKFSDKKSGHNPFGGWKDEGRQRFQELRKKIAK